jgi:hypothetical protein
MKLKRLVSYLSLGLLTAALGVSAYYWLSPHISTPGEAESPPCRGCAGVYAEASSGIPTVSLCDLEHTPEVYDGRIVRVTALLKHDSGYFGLGDGQQCPREKFIEAEFGSFTQACRGLRERLDNLLGHKHICWKHPFGFDGSVRATVVGRFVINKDGRATPGDGHLRLALLCIEEIEGEDTQH